MAIGNLPIRMRRPQRRPAIARGALALGLALLAAAPVHAACLSPNNTSLVFDLPDYPFWRAAGQAMRECGNTEIRYGFDAATSFSDSETSGGDLGHAVGVSNAGLSRLMAGKLLQPLDNLVEKYRDRLDERQLIRRDGRVMAIAVTVNVPVMAVHDELLQAAGAGLPTDLAELAEAARKLEQAPESEFGLSMPLKAGWNLTYAFASLLASSGSPLLGEGNAPRFNSAEGLAALEQLVGFSKLLPKEHLESDASGVINDLINRRAPIGILWASSTGALDNPSVSRVVGKMSIHPVPPVTRDGTPAALSWWDGFAIPVSASPEQAEAAFRVLLEGLDREMLEQNRDIAIWLLKDFVPGRFAKGALDAIAAGVGPLPMDAANDLAFRALSSHLEAALRGEKPAAAALAEAEADYLKAARERGIAGF